MMARMAMAMIMVMTMMMMMMMMMTASAAASEDCGAVCLSRELAIIRNSLREIDGLKQTLKEMQHSIYANQFFIKRNWAQVSGPPPDYFCPKEMPKSCYLFIEEKKTWNAAQQVCMGKRGHLVAIETWEENNYLKKQIQGLNYGSQAWWTGGTNDGVPGQWKWKMPAGEDETLQYHDWDNNQPDNHGRKETVIEMWGHAHRWNDRPNTNKNMFICEFDKPKEQ